MTSSTSTRRSPCLTKLRRRTVPCLLTMAAVMMSLTTIGAAVGGGVAGAEWAGPPGAVSGGQPTDNQSAGFVGQITSLTVSPNPALIGTSVTITLQYSGGAPQSEFGSVITDLNDEFDPLACSDTLISGTSTDGTTQEVCPIAPTAYVGIYDVQGVVFTPGPPPSVVFLGGESPFRVVSGSSPELRITSPSLPGGSVWNRTNRDTYLAGLAASGGNPPYKWSLVGGSLPPGLRLHRSTGVISGKATLPGRYSFTMQAVDKRTKRTNAAPSSQYTASAILSIQIS
jgi:hypothetical protein